MGRANPNRSAYLARMEKTRREAQDAEIINANADRLNREAMDVLEYQGLPVGPARLAGTARLRERHEITLPVRQIAP